MTPPSFADAARPIPRFLFRLVTHLGVCALLFAFTAPAGAHDSAVVDERPSTIRCGTFDIRSRIGVAQPTGPARGTLPCDHTPVGPPPNPQVGDSWDWYIWALNGPPTATLQSCTVRGMGANCYIVVQDSQWNVTMNQAKVDTIVDRFENSSIGSFPTQGIWDLNTSHFGMPPDALDQDPRVYVLYYDFDVSSDGFFWSFDQQCDDVAQYHSNECDVVYMNCSDFDAAGNYLVAVLAHELEHLIHYNQDPNEAAWVDEGMGELAMWLYGNPDNISSFNTSPDRNLTSFTGAWADYIKTYLWSLYFYERYGGQLAVKALVAEPANSISGFENVLDDFLYAEDFVDVFSDWVVANYLDDTTIGDGRYGYLGDTLPPFQPFATFSTYPVGPNSAAVQHWAADYVRYLSGGGISVTFDGADASQWTVRALLLDTVTPTEVIPMSLDGLQSGLLSLPAFGTTHEELVMVYAGASTSGGTVYEYSAQTGAVTTPTVPRTPQLRLAVHGSATARPALVFTVPDDVIGVEPRLEIVDVAGRRVRRFASTPVMPGTHVIEWDGVGDAGERVASGTYFAHLAVGDQHRTAAVTLVR